MTDRDKEPRLLVTLVEEICKEEGIICEQLVGGGWHLRLQKDGEMRFIVGYSFDLNTSAAQQIARDKGASYDLMTRQQVPHLQAKTFFRYAYPELIPEDGNMPTIHAHAREAGFPLVVKANNGTGGKDVYRVSNPVELEKRVQQLFQSGNHVQVGPFYEINHEYRCMYLDGQVLFVYEKIRQEDEWRHNLAHGATTEMIENPSQELLDLAKRAAEALTMRFCSVDVVDVAGELMILEVNAGVMCERFGRESAAKRALAKDLYHKAVLKMFEE